VLAAYLAIDPPKAPLTRERAARLLWGDADPARRSGNLRQLLARVKDAQVEEGFELFLIDSENVAIDPGAAVVDATLVLGARADTTDQRLVELCKAYCGDLLFGLDEGGEEFTRWLWSRRAMLRQQFVAVVSANVEASIGVLDPEEVLFVARRLVEADQYQEAGHRAAMRIHAARGEFDSALRIHRRLLDLLRETGGRPSTATTTLVAEISARARPRSRASEDKEGGAEDASFETASAMPNFIRSMRLPRLSLNFGGLTTLPAFDGQWAEALFDDAAIQLWRTRAFVVTRPADLKPRPIDLIERGRREPCDYVLDCRVVGREDHRQLTISLVCSASAEILWIHRFEFGEPLARATRDIVVACVHQIEQAELRALAEGPERTTAYRLTLQGNRMLRSIDLPSIRRARQIFRAALAVDPEHAPTLAAVSKAYRLEWLRLARADDKELDLAIDFARQAITAGPEAAHGLHQLGICSIYKKRHEFGLEALQRAERYTPYDEELIADYSDALISAGLTAEGLAKVVDIVERQLVPSDHVLWISASGQYLVGRYEEALGILSRLSSQEPTYQLRAACHAMLGQREEAGRYARKLQDILPDFTVASRIGMVPLRRREDLEHYEFGLRSAGFD
jgi:DNA-binding SARP family transcriptional activator/tetratricopeptide (TPR) repeat protein